MLPNISIQKQLMSVVTPTEEYLPGQQGLPSAVERLHDEMKREHEGFLDYHKADFIEF